MLGASGSDGHEGLTWGQERLYRLEVLRARLDFVARYFLVIVGFMGRVEKRQ